MPKQQEVHPNSSRSTGDSQVSRLKDVLQLPDGPKQDKQACPTWYKLAIAARELCFVHSRPTITAVTYRNRTVRRRVYVWHHGESSRHSKSVLSANLKKIEVLQLVLQLNQAFSFRIVVWDSKLLRHGNWGELGPF